MTAQNNDCRNTGLLIPAIIERDTSLSWIVKALFSIIYSFINHGQKFFGSNDYLCERLNIKERQLQEYLALLKSKGYIKCCIDSNNKRYIITQLEKMAAENDDCAPVPQPAPAPKPAQPQDNINAQQVIDNWNAIATEHSRPKIRVLCDDQRKHLKERLKEHKITLDQFFKYIRDALDNDVSLAGNDNWHGADFDYFLRPKNFRRTISAAENPPEFYI